MSTFLFMTLFISLNFIQFEGSFKYFISLDFLIVFSLSSLLILISNNYCLLISDSFDLACSFLVPLCVLLKIFNLDTFMWVKDHNKVTSFYLLCNVCCFDLIFLTIFWNFFFISFIGLLKVCRFIFVNFCFSAVNCYLESVPWATREQRLNAKFSFSPMCSKKNSILVTYLKLKDENFMK